MSSSSSGGSRAYIKVKCDGFGEDELRLSSLSGVEELSALYHFDLRVLCKNHDVPLGKFLGKKVVVHVPLPTDAGDGGVLPKSGARYFAGIVAGAEYSGVDQEYAVYQIAVSPHLLALNLRSNCRIFQDLTVPEIAKKILAEHGLTGVKYNDEGLSGRYEKKDFVVQYRESDFQFVSRLFEQEGIYYYFKHSEAGETLTVVDAMEAHKTVAGLERVPVYEGQQGSVAPGDHIRTWSVSGRVASHKFMHGDFDFKQPRSKLQSTAQGAAGTVSGEVYDHPGAYIYDNDGIREAPEGDRYARIRLEELRANSEQATANAASVSLFPGATFTLVPGQSSPRKGDGKAYLVKRASYSISGAGLASGSSAGGRSSSALTVMPTSIAFRPARRTPRPVVTGPQTAIVVGRAGEEIYTDKFGRVKLQFHWDREGKRDEKSSCWVRVSQSWAGKRWGGIQIPRIGQEVIVEFLSGDPDQPIVTGRVYNGENMPPYDLPTNASQSGVKSNSTKGGAVTESNELRFEDKKGSEEVYLHAQKDMTRVVEHDDSLEVKHDQTVKINNNRTETLADGNDTVTLDKGNYVRTMSMGKAVIEAKQSILLKVGQSTILIDNSGVTVKGMMIKIEGQSMANMKSPMTTVNGDATVTIKGGVVMIN